VIKEENKVKEIRKDNIDEKITVNNISTDITYATTTEIEINDERVPFRHRLTNVICQCGVCNSPTFKNTEN
jgi:hypothetical protein